MIHSPPNVILASQSMGRKKLLEKLGIPFTIIPTDIDEDRIVGSTPKETVQKRAHAKAIHVHTHIDSYLAIQSHHNLIIAADSMVILDDLCIGKPKDANDAKSILSRLSGKTHRATTHVVVIETKGKKEISHVESTHESLLTMKEMTRVEIDQYTNTYDLSPFAGCYSLEEAPWDLFTKIEGSYTNVIGLPFECILPLFRHYCIL